MMKTRINIWVDRITSSQSIAVGSLALIVGVGTAAGVWLFKWLIQVINGLTFGRIAGWPVAVVPLVGGLAIGLLTRYLIGTEKLHGTAEIMQSVALAGGRLRYYKMPAKTAAAILSIGTGASVGPEDPSVQIGANLGSMFGQIFKMSDDRIRTLTAAGAASAISAAFNAPIAGVFFALEIVLGEISGGSLGIILVASVVSAVVTQAVSGNSPAFQIPQYAFKSILEFPLYLILGLLAGPISAFYVRLLYVFQDFFGKWNVSQIIKTASAGLALGIVGIYIPQVFGVGYGTIGEVLNKGDLNIWLLIALMVAKLIMTPVSIGGGFWGGVFAPSLFIGAMMGGAFGVIASKLIPSLSLNPAAFALVGMAAVLAGAVHAPLTSVILLFEMTNDYHIILPLMFAVAISMIISQRIQPDSVYSLGLARHGIRLDRGRDIEVMSAITVGEVMRSETETLSESMSLNEAADKFSLTKHHGLPVVDGNGLLTGILTIQDIETSTEDTVEKACTHELQVAFPDETLNIALRRMSQRDVGRLPVVARENPRKMVGILGRADIIHAYDIALTRRVSQRHKQTEYRLDTMTPVHVDVSNIRVEPGSLIAGKRMKEIPFPPSCLVASIRRGSQVFIPKGDTMVRVNDVLVVVAEGESRPEISRLCSPPE